MKAKPLSVAIVAGVLAVGLAATAGAQTPVGTQEPTYD